MDADSSEKQALISLKGVGISKLRWSGLGGAEKEI
jgi:hypothetical protein